MSDRDRVAQVLAAEARWTQAHLDMDLDVLEEMVAPDYFRLEPDGRRTNREQLLQSYRSGLRHWELAESDRHHVALMEDVAIVSGRWRGRGVNDGSRFDYSANFLAVYIYRDARWQLLTEQSTPIDDE